MFRKENRIFKKNTTICIKKFDRRVYTCINNLRFDVNINIFNEVFNKLNEFYKVLQLISSDIKVNTDILYQLLSYSRSRY